MKNKSYQCEACSGKICVTQCDKKPTYCPLHAHKDPCWVDVEQESQQTHTAWKKGDWAWCPADNPYTDDMYFQVLEVHPDGMLRVNSYLLVNSKICQKASVRPYKGPELVQVVGKVVKLRNLHQRSFMTAALVIGYNEHTEKVFLCTCSSGTASLTETAAGLWLSAAELSGLTTIDGKPCGVLQHRSPNTGELVD